MKTLQLTFTLILFFISCGDKVQQELTEQTSKETIKEESIIKEDGKEISRTFHRHVLHPDSDISGEPQETQDVCNAIWTDEVKAGWITFQAEQEAKQNPEE